jgi:hypothetical protein
MPDKDPHEVLWWRDENDNVQETTRANGEALEWKPMTPADLKKTFPTGDEDNPQE